METVKTNRTQLVLLLKETKGKLLTITFQKEDKSLRTVNGQYTGNITELGWHQFKSKGEYKLFDPKRLKEVRARIKKARRK